MFNKLAQRMLALTLLMTAMILIAAPALAGNNRAATSDLVIFAASTEEANSTEEIIPTEEVNPTEEVTPVPTEEPPTPTEEQPTPTEETPTPTEETPTSTPTDDETPTATPSATPTDEGTPSATPTDDGTPTPTPTDDQTPTPTPTDEGTPTDEPLGCQRNNPERLDCSSLQVTVQCVAGVAIFTITNTGEPGNGDMRAPTEYRLVVNRVVIETGEILLPGGGSMTVEYDGGETATLHADQQIGHPGNSRPRASAKCTQDD